MFSLDDRRAEESRTFSVFLAWFGLLLLSAVWEISLVNWIKFLEPCDLEKALGLLGLDIASPCTYNNIKEMFPRLFLWGIGELVVNLFFFVMIFIELRPEKLKRALFFIAFVVAIVFSIVMIASYYEVLTAKGLKTDVKFAYIKKTMMDLLTKTYTSDNITSNDAISNNWNKFFIEYECCAINQVQGTINDFDSTPWCTISGSCASLASEIPKTCCNGVSDDNYENAPTACYSSVNPGTYKSNCMKAIKLLSATNIDENNILNIQNSLLMVGILEIIKVVIMLGLMIKHGITNRKTCTRRNDKSN